MAHAVLLTGLGVEPLSAYLACLGVFRIVARQLDPQIRARFTPMGFELDGVQQGRLVDFFLSQYRPSPVASPWNSASGFYSSSKGNPARAAIAALTASGQPRLGALVEALAAAQRVVASLGYTDAPADEAKAQLISRLRREWSDEAIEWLDAVAVASLEEAVMMPLLGSGGNEGVLDYSGMYFRSLAEVVIGDSSASESQLRALLLGTPTLALVPRAGGQFDPGGAGGFNTGQGFEHKDLPNNPWAFILLIEGALAWASSVFTRSHKAGYRFAVSPFTVRHVAAGHGSAAAKENDAQQVRAELWVPVWDRFARFGELAHLLVEGRADVQTRHGPTRLRAGDSLDFARAVSSLGVDRGVSEFCRYALVKRRGDSFIALPAGRIQVQQRPATDLLVELDGELDQLDRFLRAFPGDGPPATLVGLRRSLADGAFDVAVGRAGAVLRLLRVLGRVERSLAKRDPGKEPSLSRALGNLSGEWLIGAYRDVPDVPELGLAAGVASLWSPGVPPLRSYLAPVDPDKPWAYLPAVRALGFTGSSTVERIANLLQRRMLDAARERGGTPTVGGAPVALTDVSLFLEGNIDESLLDDLIFALSLVRPRELLSRGRRGSGFPVVPRAFAQLKLVHLPGPLRWGGTEHVVVPEPRIVSLLRAGRVGDAVSIAHARLRASGFAPRRAAPERLYDQETGPRLAAGLLFPLAERDVAYLASIALLPIQERTQGAQA